MGQRNQTLIKTMKQIFSITAYIDEEGRLTTQLEYNEDLPPDTTTLGLSTIFVHAKSLLESLGNDLEIDLVELATSTIQAVPGFGEAVKLHTMLSEYLSQKSGLN